MTPRRLTFWMLVTAGVAVGHVAGYAAAHPDAAAREAALGGHAYLPGAAAAVIPLGVLAALWWAVRTARTLDLSGTIPARQVALAQLGVFAVQEVAERLVGGGSAAAVLTERGVWFGVVAQVVVAVGVTRALDVVRRAVRAVTGGRTRPGARLRPRVLALVSAAWRSATASPARSPRAPPVAGSPS